MKPPFKVGAWNYDCGKRVSQFFSVILLKPNSLKKKKFGQINQRSASFENVLTVYDFYLQTFNSLLDIFFTRKFKT